MRVLISVLRFAWRLIAPSKRALAISAVAGLWVPVARANFPDRPVHLILPAPAGGTLDIVGRLLGQELSERWKQPVISENRPGGLSVIGTDVLAKATPDGYTFGLLPSNDAVNPIVLRDMPYDTFKGLSPIAPVVTAPGVLVVNPNRFDVPDLGGAIADARADPGRYFYASPGDLTAGHRAMELLKYDAAIDIQHVPYNGGPPAVLDLLAGRVQFLIISVPTVEPYLKTGQLRALAVTSRQRFVGLPDIPTVAESGYPGFEEVEWYGAFAPAGTPSDVILKLSEDVQEVLAEPEVQKKLLALGALSGHGGADAMQSMFQNEYDRWRILANKIRLHPD